MGELASLNVLVGGVRERKSCAKIAKTPRAPRKTKFFFLASLAVLAILALELEFIAPAIAARISRYELQSFGQERIEGFSDLSGVHELWGAGARGASVEPE
jgi:hypothetical protein